MFRLRSAIVFLAIVVLHNNVAPAEEARALLERAIQAHGGAKLLERTKRGHLKATGKTRDGANFVEETKDIFFDLPNRYRETYDLTREGQTLHRLSVVNGNRNYVREGNAPPYELHGLPPLPLEGQWFAVLPQLLLLTAKNITLTSLPDRTENGRVLAGVRAVSQGGRLDVYFDKSTGLLARVRRPPLLNSALGKEPVGEIVFEDHHVIQGVRFPMHWKSYVGDTLSSDVHFSTVEFLDNIDASNFAVPKTLTAKPDTGDSTPKSASKTEPIRGPTEETPARWDRRLIIGTLGVGAVVGLVWLLVRASHRGKAEAPPS